MKEKNNKHLFAVLMTVILVSLVFIAGCSSSDDNGDSDIYSGKLVNATLIQTYTADEVNGVIREYYEPTGIDVTDLLETSTDVNAYVIEYYTTNVDGQKIIVSGLVSIPVSDEESYPVVQYHHGTQFNNQDVPSNPDRSGEAILASALFAGHGYVTSLPDYIGQGKSTVMHPYLHSESEAVCSADMLVAVKELCQLQNVNLTSKLFICGLSEGGHVTMALQQHLETTSTEQPFILTGSAPIAGPYDLTVAWNFWEESSPYSCSPLAAHLILAYKEIYSFTDTLSDIFQSPYDTTITELNNGSYNCKEMYDILPKTLAELLQAKFISSVNSKEHPIYKEMVENNTYEFVPVTPTMLMHAEEDELLPYSASQEVYDYMISQGAQNVELVNLGPGIGHEDSFMPGTLLAKKWFDTLK